MGAKIPLLKEEGSNKILMPYNKDDKYQKAFTRWVNHRAIFNSVKWKDYKYAVTM